MSPVKKAVLKTILIADDDPAVTVSVSTYLQNLGYRTVTAADGEAAFKAIEEARPDLVILDIDMPRGSGIVLTRQLRAHKDRALRAIPVIMLTAKSDRRHEAYSDEAGATAFVPKPVALADLAARIKEFL